MARLALVTAACMAVAYFVCGIPFGLVATRGDGVDVRKAGSGNIGMTNVARTVGGKAAAATFAGDMGKGLVCMLLARAVVAGACFGGDWSMLAPSSPFALCMTLVFSCCVLGHVFSPYLRFHGGKGISVGFGASLGLFWPIGLGMLAVFAAFAVPSRYVSLGSVMAAVSLPVQCALWGMGPAALAPVTVVACVVIWAHRNNIRKLASHQESRFSVRHRDGADEGTDGGERR